MAVPSTTDTERWIQQANDAIAAAAAKGEMPDDALFLSLAVQLSAANIAQGLGGPFGALLVDFSGALPRVVGVGANHVTQRGDASAHAEIEALRDAAARTDQSDMKGLVLYSSCECCPMCLSAAYGAGVARIAYVNTREQAEIAGFSDRLQYDMLSQPRKQLMMPVAHFPEPLRSNAEYALGLHGAVVVDQSWQVVATGNGNPADPTAPPSVEAVRSALAVQSDTSGMPEMWLPEGWRLICRDRPHPMGVVVADWARLLRPRDPQYPSDPSYDAPAPARDRVIYMRDIPEQIIVYDRKGTDRIPQDADVTYRQIALPPHQRAVPTARHEGKALQQLGERVFDDWVRGVQQGVQQRY